uniref:Rad51-like C-terminal domain-containing protein n=1 Tax=Oryza punctata TaxID=4537 RepID=A0A0E0L0Q9_ORYPU
MFDQDDSSARSVPERQQQQQPHSLHLCLYAHLSIEIQEAEEILKVAVCANRSKGVDGPRTSIVHKGAQNAWDMLSDEQSRRHINTGSADLNNILGGGIHCKDVTEIDGDCPNQQSQESVKLNWITFVSIQLAINVQIPVEYGGLCGKAVYIDTEGSFMVERVYQIAEGCISDILEYFPHCHDKAPAGQEKLEYFRICCYTEQIAVINYPENFLEEHKDAPCYDGSEHVQEVEVEKKAVGLSTDQQDAGNETTKMTYSIDCDSVECTLALVLPPGGVRQV